MDASAQILWGVHAPWRRSGGGCGRLGADPVGGVGSSVQIRWGVCMCVTRLLQGGASHRPKPSFSAPPTQRRPPSVTMVRISVLNDTLKAMYNAEKRGKRQVLVRPVSKVVIKFLQVMQKHGRGFIHWSHFRAQLEDLRDTLLTLELHLITFGTHPRVHLGYTGDKASLI